MFDLHGLIPVTDPNLVGAVLCTILAVFFTVYGVAGVIRALRK